MRDYEKIIFSKTNKKIETQIRCHNRLPQSML